MRFVISILFLVSIFSGVWAAGSAVSVFQTIGAYGISDPGFAIVKFRESLYGHAVCTAFVTATLLLMTIDAFRRRARVRGIIIVLLTVLSVVFAAVSVRDVGALIHAALTVKSSSESEPGFGSEPFYPAPLLQRMPIPKTPAAIIKILETAPKRALTSLCLLGFGTALTLVIGNKASRQKELEASAQLTPPLPPAPPPISRAP
jgi:hypothetical protein